ncbi:hypothetical protein TcG_09077 [Trypanosoma cruzi]|nr:hypothetical protein TcG_09077 [Trypanosoma cruzi]
MLDANAGTLIKHPLSTARCLIFWSHPRCNADATVVAVMGIKMERGAAKDILLHMCLLHSFCWGDFNLEEEGWTLHDALTWRGYYLLLLFLLLVWSLVPARACPDLLSLSGAAPWLLLLLFWLFAGGKTHCE